MKRRPGGGLDGGCHSAKLAVWQCLCLAAIGGGLDGYQFRNFCGFGRSGVFIPDSDETFGGGLFHGAILAPCHAQPGGGLDGGLVHGLILMPCSIGFAPLWRELEVPTGGLPLLAILYAIFGGGFRLTWIAAGLWGFRQQALARR